MTTAYDDPEERSAKSRESILPGDVEAPVEEEPRERPRVTFMGNSYDLASLGALATGVVLLLMCLTCNQAAYCLPCVPVVLGVIGLVTAKDAIDEERTRLWSWIGIGSSGVVMALIALAIIAYLLLVGFIVFMSEMNY